MTANTSDADAGSGTADNPQARTGGTSRRGRAGGNVNEGDTRTRVIKAAIQTILDRGLYRSSSNAIAEQAGLTWGVIQYYFGTREGLMLAVLEEAARRFSTDLKSAKITGETIGERIEQYFDVLALYYGSAEYLAFVQVVISLSHDPRTSDQTRQTISDINAVAGPELHRLQNEVFAGTGVQRTDVRALLFHALRGMSLSHIMLDTVPLVDADEFHKQFKEQRSMLSHALTLLVEDMQHNEP